MLNVDQKWIKKEDGTMELIEEVEVEREVDNQPTEIELLKEQIETSNQAITELSMIIGGMF